MVTGIKDLEAFDSEDIQILDRALPKYQIAKFTKIRVKRMGPDSKKKCFMMQIWAQKSYEQLKMVILHSG